MIRPASKADVDVAAAGEIHVCPLSHMLPMVRKVSPQRIVTIINERMIPATPEGFDAAAHLKLVCSDICEPADGRICPEPQHVEALIAFVREWNHDRRLLIHCLAGVSRSTAAAYISLCALNEGASELKIAQRLRQASPSAMPNRLLVGLADEILGRKGRMLEAIAAIGPGRLDGDEGWPFWLPSRLG